MMGNWVSSVGIVTNVTGYGLNGNDSIPGGARDFSLLHSIQTGSGAHAASHLVGSGVCSRW
jgi:hypothetical protein